MSDRLTQLLSEATHPPSQQLNGQAVWRRGRRRRARRLAAPALVVALLAVGGVVAIRAGDDEMHDVTAGPGPDSVTTLVIPPVGDPVPDVLVDGTPVFVVQHPDGTVDVFLAVSTHTPHGLAQMLGWCPRIYSFDDGMFSSAWDPHGRPQGGPAPYDLARFEVVDRTAETVTVGPLRRTTTRSKGDPRAEDIPACSAGSPGFHADGMVFPQLEPASTLHEALSAQPPGIVLIHGAALVVTDDGTVTACDEQSATSPSSCTETTVDGPEGALAGTAPFVVVHGDFLARVEGASLSDLVFTRGWMLTGVEPDPPGDCGSLDVDAARRTNPAPLIDAYRCLSNAFEAGEPALLRLLFTDGDGNRTPTSYEIDGGQLVVSRQYPDGQRQEICTDLVGDDDGTPRPERCHPA
jgi:hypothetical protein